MYQANAKPPVRMRIPVTISGGTIVETICVMPRSSPLAYASIT